MSEEQKTEDKVKEWMNESLPAALDRAYNIAIDHAIEVVKEFESATQVGNIFFVEPQFIKERTVYEKIISKLNQLKK